MNIYWYLIALGIFVAWIVFIDTRVVFKKVTCWLKGEHDWMGVATPRTEADTAGLTAVECQRCEIVKHSDEK